MFPSSSDSKLFLGQSNYSHSDNMVHHGGASQTSPSSSGSPGSISYLPPYLMGGSDAAEGSSSGLNGRTKMLGGGFGNGVHDKTAKASPSMEEQGPPVQELFDDGVEAQLKQNKAVDMMYYPIYQNSEFPSSPVISSPGKSESVSFTSVAQVDPFYTQGEEFTNEEQLDDTWITVYGFPPVASSYVLLQFSQYGAIVEHKVSPYGNWIHIHYQMKMHAKKALSKNGKVFGGNFMVGVKPCIDLDVMSESSKEHSRLDVSSCANITKCNSIKKNMRSLTQAYRSLSTDFEDSMNESDHENSLLDISPRVNITKRKSLKENIRPLTQGCKLLSTNDYQVVPQNKRTPQKSDSFVSTTMEYLLNW